jgi:hypothetical protein
VKAPAWRDVLGHRCAPWGAALLALLLALPSVTTGFAADDHLHRIVSRPDTGLDGLRSRPLDLFRFATGDPDQGRASMDSGLFPWWADPTVKMSFFRPLSSATHAVDQALWVDSAAMCHLHNLAWFAASLFAVAAIYRRFLAPPWLATLAFLLYAVDDARGPTLGWIANRNALIAVALAAPAILLHDRWRRDGWTPGAFLAPAMIGVGLLGGEAALATCGYLAAYAWHLDPAPLRSRFASLVPAAAVVFGWAVVSRGLHYGVSGSGVYVDPLVDPLPFLSAVVARAPLLLIGQFALPWSDLLEIHALYLPSHAPFVIGAAVVAVVGGAALLAPLLRSDAVARFFATGLLLALIPVCGTFAADRLLGFVGVGAMGLVAQALATAHPRALALPLAGIHLLLAPPLLGLRSRSMDTIGHALERANDSLPSDEAVSTRTVLLLNPPGDAFAGFLLPMRASMRQPMPARFRWLATGEDALTVRRLSATALSVRPDRGFSRLASEQMLRSPRRPLGLGVVRLSGVTVEVTSLTSDGRPAEALFTFDRALEDPSLSWLRWGAAGFEAWSPPPVGSAEIVPAVDLVKAVLGP